MRNFEQPFNPGNESEMKEPLVEDESQKELEEEFHGFEMNLDKVQNVTAELGGGKEIVELSPSLTSEQKLQIEQKIAQLQKDLDQHKYAAIGGLHLLNPLDTLMYMVDNKGILENKIWPFLAYASGGVPLIGLEEFIRNGFGALKDRHGLRKLEKEKQQLGES